MKDMREAAKKEERNPVFCTERAGDLATSCGGATKGYKLCVQRFKQPLRHSR